MRLSEKNMIILGVVCRLLRNVVAPKRWCEKQFLQFQSIVLFLLSVGLFANVHVEPAAFLVSSPCKTFNIFVKFLKARQQGQNKQTVKALLVD